MSKVDLDYNKTQTALRELYRRFIVIRVGAVFVSSTIAAILFEIAAREPAWDKWLIYSCFVVYVTAAVCTFYQLLRILVLVIKCYVIKDLSLKRVKKTADNRLSLRGPFFKKYFLDIE